MKTTAATRRIKMKMPVKLVLALALLSQLCLFESQAHSSYYGDYLLPARMALNKIQQSFQQASSTDPPSSPSSPPPEPAAPTGSGNQSSSIPIEGELTPPQPGDRWARVEENMTITVAATEAAVTDTNKAEQTTTTTTTTTTTEAPITSTTEQAATTTQTETPTTTPTTPRTIEASTPEATSTPAASTETTTTIQSLDAAGESGAQAKLEERAKEAELEAIAAVDASIGFGGVATGSATSANANGVDLFGLGAALSDACYDEYGNARFCEPPFENVAFERQVEVSSECGQPPSRFCTAHSDQLRNCHMCNAQNPKKRHPAAYLTDMQNSQEPTCWVSAPIPSAHNSTSSGQSQQLEPLKADNVSLVLRLDKKYEIVYVSLQFCSLKPDSLAIYKSADFGQSWQPYQFYSSHCRRLYGRQQALSQQQPAKGLNAEREPEAQCQQTVGAAGPADRVAFSPLEGRQPHQLERSPALQNWVTATTLRVSLDRHQAGWLQATSAHYQQLQHNNQSQQDQEQLISPSDTYNYAISDLTVGGRCKCNGHASRCVHGKDGRLQCDCRHNTAGRDCDRCAPFHFDRPWARATQLDASPCQPCNCNGHSRKCRFDPELFRLSGRRSGGVCMGCRDNTAGRFCHYCKEGYTRDHSKPMNDREACKECACHPIGSLGRVCNQTTGQCACKEGVAGPQCTRCAPGYQQSSSPTEPCIKLPEANENDINSDAAAAVEPLSSSSAGNQPPAAAAATIGADGAEAGASIEPAEPVQPPPARKDSRRPGWMQVEPQEDAVDQEEGQEQDQEPARQRPSWKKGGRTRYGGWPSQPARPPQFQVDPLASLDESAEASLPDDAPYGQRRPPADYYDAIYQQQQQQHHHHHPQYPAPSKSRYLNEFSQATGRRPPPARLLPPADLQGHYGPQEDSMDAQNNNNNNQPIYSDNFNQIQGAWRQAGKRPRYPSFAQQQPPPPPPQAVAASQVDPMAAACNDCRRAMRRITQRQFCHLDYAIKTIVHYYQVAEDWTKVEVEVQDIFKSPAGNQQQQQQPAQSSSTTYLDNMLQADEPQQFNANSSITTSNSDQQGSDLAPKGRQQQQHRTIIVGTRQWIWVPTEDFICRCPKLKIGSAYLMMGSVEQKSDGSVSLQLDRHGVSYEWRSSSSLQEKLMGFQQKQALGRCNSQRL